jgi:hypothetical protein
MPRSPQNRGKPSDRQGFVSFPRRDVANPLEGFQREPNVVRSNSSLATLANAWRYSAMP